MDRCLQLLWINTKEGDCWIIYKSMLSFVKDHQTVFHSCCALLTPSCNEWERQIVLSCSTLVAPLSMGFSSQEYWSGLPFPSPGESPNLESFFYLMSSQHLVHECADFLPQCYRVLICTLLMPYDMMFRFLLSVFLNILNSVFPSLVLSSLCIAAFPSSEWVEDICPFKSLYTNVYSSFIHNCQIPGAIMISFCRWMDK